MDYALRPLHVDPPPLQLLQLPHFNSHSSQALDQDRQAAGRGGEELERRGTQELGFKKLVQIVARARPYKSMETSCL
ncbi:unnamed protein product [Sphenostylis stenocarpa]|uniref:Uncharacterized protein n=1 Tax=Sphenostylis stenocarpa TaxID=92480 RepID=A0AA86SYG7_9FABA|nr:unnamed protein product [Sphenostylis stenocarpa]